jgi:monovalent cation:H+ antiporter-2, CPA2 family
LFTAIEPVQRWLRARSSLARKFERPDDPLAALPMQTPHEKLSGQVVLVGFGRVGRRIADDLTARGVHFVLAEQNRELVEAARERGIPAVVGNAAEPVVLIQAHIARAAMLVIATPDTFDVRKMVEIAKALNPSVQCVVRTHNAEEAELLRKETGGRVFVGEEELAGSMTRHVLDALRAKVTH